MADEAKSVHCGSEPFDSMGQHIHWSFGGGDGNELVVFSKQHARYLIDELRRKGNTFVDDAREREMLTHVAHLPETSEHDKEWSIYPAVFSRLVSLVQSLGTAVEFIGQESRLEEQLDELLRKPSRIDLYVSSLGEAIAFLTDRAGDQVLLFNNEQGLESLEAAVECGRVRAREFEALRKKLEKMVLNGTLPTGGFRFDTYQLDGKGAGVGLFQLKDGTFAIVNDRRASEAGLRQFVEDHQCAIDDFAPTMAKIYGEGSPLVPKMPLREETFDLGDHLAIVRFHGPKHIEHRFEPKVKQPDQSAAQPDEAAAPPPAQPDASAPIADASGGK